MEKYTEPTMEIIEIESGIRTLDLPCHSQSGNQDAGSGDMP